MCNKCDDLIREQGVAVRSRRDVLRTGAALVAAPLLGGMHVAQAAQTSVPAANAPLTVRAYGATSAAGPIGHLQIPRRALGPHDVLLDVLYCGICHSDIHIVRSDWGPANYPVVPGHEIIGRVQAVGSAVTKFNVGDIGGVAAWSIRAELARTVRQTASRTA
jgi:alcohol dehydrogenase (NADP+)